MIFRKVIKIVATRCEILKLKCTKFDFGWGSAPDPAGGAYSAPPDPLAGFKGPTSKGREGKKGRVGREEGGSAGQGRRRKGERGQGKGEEGGKGRARKGRKGEYSVSRILAAACWQPYEYFGKKFPKSDQKCTVEVGAGTHHPPTYTHYSNGRQMAPPARHQTNRGQTIRVLAVTWGGFNTHASSVELFS